ncbi:hypothetical protein [Halobacillus litoralis]|uniref:Uncharacterized protein n=1 Tax=Halobacillus litoralis TaxID=45668 RepID=A0A410MI60_9BACI|nr:hypothetical protein [Halobacillus litoralis]QAS54414.1 hypothetical protein HLI_20425 [Halobacillus litoralis]
MHKVYLSIIALMLVAFFMMFSFTEEKNQEQKLPKEVEQESSETASNKNPDKLVIDASVFKEYFSDVKAEDPNLEGSESVSIKTDEIPEDRHRQVAAGLLIKAKKYIDANGEWVRTPGNKEPDLNSPTNAQLKELMQLKDTELATSIIQKSVLLNDAEDLIEDEEISKQLKDVSEKLIEIEIYEKETFYDFSLAYKEYQECVKLILEMTADIE